MKKDRNHWSATAAIFLLTLVVIVGMVAVLTGTVDARDPGINQPGRMGNRGGLGR